YELFSDPRCDVGELYGVTHDLDGMTGIVEHRPAVFLIDSERNVEYTWVASEWPDFPDYDEIEEAIESV
ncbi:MAG: peroxiredoxin, partial [Halobacteria archaeon]|nr:peroxiredoxin [Halobacteria archaeon]